MLYIHVKKVFVGVDEKFNNNKNSAFYCYNFYYNFFFFFFLQLAPTIQ